MAYNVYLHLTLRRTGHRGGPDIEEEEEEAGGVAGQPGLAATIASTSPLTGGASGGLASGFQTPDEGSPRVPAEEKGRAGTQGICLGVLVPTVALDPARSLFHTVAPGTCLCCIPQAANA
ncbi:hypothetical protein DAERI_180033 [Deinococcus aerius]|uniref:Uncharacterized protein n=1 Tax=Deinococcus aerius TaxID=200253 RepID=A0A2I9D006_9DEIO|nr:hypothetical protein DAERI_180033 [Deinococcus aerius]